MCRIDLTPCVARGLLHTMSSERYKTLRAYVAAQPRGKSTEAIAAELGVGTAALYAWLKGDRFPTREVALRLSKNFGISLAGLLDPEVQQAQAS